jgi:anaerobic selenocysteine-containing dehydrogenase
MIGPIEKVASACPHDCPSTCALEVERRGPTEIGRIRGAHDNGYTAGVICAKVARYADRVHHPDRLTSPMRRIGPKGEGAFEPITWDDALDLVADAFDRAARRHGSETVWPYYYGGTMGLVQRDSIHRLRHVMRYSGMRPTICATIANAGWRAGVGRVTGVDPREMADSDLVVIWGTNAVATQVNVMTHVARARKSRGARLVVVDPYRNATAESADTHLCLRPGTDGALACAVMHVLFRDGLADRDYLARYTDASDALERHLAARSPEWAAEITGLTVQEIVGFAHLYGETRRSFIRVGYGFTRQRNGAAQMHAVSCLPAVTGAWRHRGGGAFFSNAGLFRLDQRLITGADARDRDVRMLDMCRIGAVLEHEPDDLAGGPPVTAMLVQNCNPAAVAPDGNRVRKGLMRDDLFLCVHEQFLTDTARFADVVLPATTFLEHDDLYVGYGHTHIVLGPRVIEPVPETRSNHDVLCGIASRLGARHRGFDMSAWEHIDACLQASGYPGADALRESRWLDCAQDFESAHFLNGFGTPDRRFRFRADWARCGADFQGLPEYPDHLATIEGVDPDHPLRLVTAPSRQFLNTSFTEVPGSAAREGRPEVMLHPADAVTAGVEDGADVIVGNRRGQVRLHARLFSGMQAGVAVIHSVWPNSAHADGIGVNVLTSADAVPPSGGAAFHDTAVWVRPA